MKPLLTHTEHKVLMLASQGYTNPQIAEILGNSKRTVDFHLYNIYGKLEVTTKLQAYRKAQELGLLSPLSEEGSASQKEAEKMAAHLALEHWRAAAPWRGYSIYSLSNNRTEVRLYERELLFNSMSGTSLAEVVKALLKGEDS